MLIIDVVCSKGSTAYTLAQFCYRGDPGDTPLYYRYLPLYSSCLALQAYQFIYSRLEAYVFIGF